MRYQKCKENKKRCDTVENFLQQVKQGPYYVCIICHRSLYQRSVKFFEHEKYEILLAELYHPVRSLDETLFIGESCHTPCQAVCNKMALDLIPDEIQD